MAKVAILCPVAETVDPIIFQHTMALIAHSCQKGLKIKDIGVTKRMLIHTARNVLAKGFLQSDNEWAFWMDADMMLPSHTILRLLETAEAKKAQMVTGVYYQRLGEHFPVLWKKDPEAVDGTTFIENKNGSKDSKEAYKHHYVVPSPTATSPFKVDVSGFGCFLMHREALEKIQYPYFKTISDDCSEDFYFCIKAKEAGLQLWADPSLDIGHMGEAPFYTKRSFQIKKDQLKQIKV